MNLAVGLILGIGFLIWLASALLRVWGWLFWGFSPLWRGDWKMDDEEETDELRPDLS